MNLTSSQKLILALSLAGGTIFLRVMPHMPNFSAMTALALFAVVFFGWKVESFLIVLGTQLVGDLILGILNEDVIYAFHKTSLSTYGSLALIGLLGYFLSKKVDLTRTIPFAVASSLLYWGITNLHCWYTFPEYTKDLTGLYECYLSALPFLRSAFPADMIFSLAFCALAMNLESKTASEPTVS